MVQGGVRGRSASQRAVMELAAAEANLTSLWTPALTLALALALALALTLIPIAGRGGHCVGGGSAGPGTATLGHGARGCSEGSAGGH